MLIESPGPGFNIAAETIVSGYMHYEYAEQIGDPWRIGKKTFDKKLDMPF
ncbi:MAG TPA: hypothetical protein VMV10_00105 [Pirellulales bacterium]|nr:hypothetical protein [Pirellulales bacterium]